MKKTLQDQYLLIKEGKGHKGVFLTEAKRQFPNIIRNSATFDEAVASLKTKHIISENIISVMPIAANRPKKEVYETAFEAFLAEAKKKENEDEKVKAEEKKVSKPVEKDLEKNFDNTDEKNPDNMIFGQIMMGYYAEMKDPKNSEKTMQELKDIVFKNLAKDPIYYTKNAQFGIKDLGYTNEVPALGTPKEVKGKYKSSGYGDLNESIQPINEEEIKLRKVIREIISEELGEAMYQGVSIKPSKTGGGGRRNIPTDAFLSQETIDDFNFSNPGPNAPARDTSLQIPHIKIITSKDTGKPEIVISDFLYNALQNLERGRTSREKEVKKNELEKEISNMDSQVRALIKKKTNPKLSFGIYHSVDTPITYEKGVGVKIPLKEEELEEMMINEFLLKESVEKEIAEINKMAEYENLQSKLDKLEEAIKKRRSQLERLDEDEDMKALTDSKKVKSLHKDIKILESAKKKVEKMMSKFKGKKPEDKEVIDEIEDDPDVNKDYFDQSVLDLSQGKSVDSITSEDSNLALDQQEDLKDYLKSL